MKARSGLTPIKATQFTQEARARQDDPSNVDSRTGGCCRSLVRFYPQFMLQPRGSNRIPRPFNRVPTIRAAQILGNSTDFILFICQLSASPLGLPLPMVLPSQDAASRSRVACRQFRDLSSSDCGGFEQSWNSSLSSSTSKQRDHFRSSDHACSEHDDPMGRDGRKPEPQV
jgi:hypothetical protein